MNAAKKDTRYYSLDFWRGVACLLIVFYHSSLYVLENPNPPHSGTLGGLIFHIIDHFWVGVPIFFVISGYCITAACDGTRHKAKSMKQYFIRRLRRIFPPFWAACSILLLGLITTSLMGCPEFYVDNIHPVHPLSSFSRWQWLGNASLTEIWRYHVAGDKCWFLLGPSWSLCYEEQFYVVCGLLLLLTRKWFFRASAVLTVVVAGVVACNAWVKTLLIDGFFFDGRWLLFAAGILVYYRIHYATPRFAKMASLGLFCAALYALAWRFHDKKAATEEYYIGFFFAFLISLLYRWDMRIATNRLARPITWCGIMCYSIYLIHWPVIKPITHILYGAGVVGTWRTLAITLPICLGSVVACAWVFHRLVERRFLNTPPVLPWHAAGQKATPVPVSQSVVSTPAVPPSVLL